MTIWDSSILILFRLLYLISRFKRAIMNDGEQNTPTDGRSLNNSGTVTKSTDTTKTTTLKPQTTTTTTTTHPAGSTAIFSPPRPSRPSVSGDSIDTKPPVHEIPLIIPKSPSGDDVSPLTSPRADGVRSGSVSPGITPRGSDLASTKVESGKVSPLSSGVNSPRGSPRTSPMSSPRTELSSRGSHEHLTPTVYYQTF